MPSYQCYLLNGTNDIFSVDTLRNEWGDERALEQARYLLRTKYKDARALELWNRAVLIGRVENEVASNTRIQPRRPRKH